jgi:hypothetical protein
MLYDEGDNDNDNGSGNDEPPPTTVVIGHWRGVEDYSTLCYPRHCHRISLA